MHTGENTFRHRHGCSVFEWYQQNPRRGAIFDGAMTDFSRQETAALLEAYDFAGVHHLVDGGDGRGTLFDQPSVVAPAAVPADLEGSLSVQGGDFFTEAPPTPTPICSSTASAPAYG